MQYINLPCTPLGVIHILEYLESLTHFDFQIEGQSIVMIGRSHLVGCPLSLMLSHKNATVTLCHTFTHNLELHCQNADVIIVATGNPNLITLQSILSSATKEYQKKNKKIIIDIGINVISDSGSNKKRQVVGDVAFEEVKAHCLAISPVPGGVGPLTLAMLFQNTLRAAKCRQYSKICKTHSCFTPTPRKKKCKIELDFSLIFFLQLHYKILLRLFEVHIS
jgi:methylenetetrahydrofolate dehydrogenase (NADP+)/methenyltetrahydrofolate cyclohydrolase